jgi:hypothetical protein
MVHGDCLSAGCYAMTDKQMAEIYAIAREAFRGGQREFQLEIFPFEMTAENMARRRDNKNFAFWKNLKTGYDHFAVTREEPKVAVCQGRYVFDATAAPGTRFDPTAPCPPYTIAPAIQTAVAAKERADSAKFAALVRENAPIAAAYIPQDGRLRLTLAEPIHMDRFGNVPTMTADAGAAVGSRVAQAHEAAPATEAPEAKNAGGALAMANTASPNQPAGQETPFYKRLFSLVGGSADNTPTAATAQAVPATAAVPMPVPNPAVRHHYRRTASIAGE